MPLLKVQNISKIYQIGDIKTIAIENISFSVNQAEFVAIMGPSGSGKSTLMHILGALDTPTSGTYILDGTDVSQMTEDQLADTRNQKIGFVFQAYNLLPRTSALRNVMIPMMYGNVPSSKRASRAKKYLQLVGLGDRLFHTSNQLSGGQQQRVAIARALAMRPAIILADEPTGNIATKQAAEIMDIFVTLNRQGHTIIMITHEPDIAAYAQRIINIVDGHIKKDSLNKNQVKK